MTTNEYIVICNGGPNDKTVGKRVRSKRQAIGIAKTMLDDLSPSIIEIQLVPKGQEVLDCLPVKTEAEAGETK